MFVCVLGLVDEVGVGFVVCLWYLFEVEVEYEYRVCIVDYLVVDIVVVLIGLIFFLYFVF